MYHFFHIIHSAVVSFASTEVTVASVIGSVFDIFKIFFGSLGVALLIVFVCGSIPLTLDSSTILW